MTDVTRLVRGLRGTPDAADRQQLFRTIYDALYGLARQQRRHWSGDHTLNTTALVHEAYLKLMDQTQADYRDRAHFLAVAALVMRHLLIDYARARKAQKRGGDLQRLDLDEVVVISDTQIDELLALNHALDQLAVLDERQAKVVECRFFGGMTVPETAEALDISATTVKRDWASAQAFLYRHMNDSEQA